MSEKPVSASEVPDGTRGGDPALTENIRRNSLRSYQQNRLSKLGNDAGTQHRLKRRVFETFDALLRHLERPGLTAGQVLIDLGAGDGAFAKVAADAGLDATGLDASDGIDLESDQLPLEDHSVDIVTGISVIEHVRDPSVMLAETRRVLRPGGSIILVTPNWQYSQHDFYDDPTHVHPYTPVSIAAALQNNGFEQVYVGPWVVKKPAWLWALSWRFFYARWFLPFRGDAPRWIPGILKGKSRSLLATAVAPLAELD